MLNTGMRSPKGNCLLETLLPEIGHSFLSFLKLSKDKIAC